MTFPVLPSPQHSFAPHGTQLPDSILYPDGQVEHLLMSDVHEKQFFPIVPVFPSPQHSFAPHETQCVIPLASRFIVVFLLHETQAVMSLVHSWQSDAVGVNVLPEQHLFASHFTHEPSEPITYPFEH